MARLGGVGSLTRALAGIGEVTAEEGGLTLVRLGEDVNTASPERLAALRSALGPVLNPGFRSLEEYFAQRVAHPERGFSYQL